MTTPNPKVTSDEAFSRLGLITKELHQAMIALGGQGPTLHSMAAEIPDARERLAYVARMTEQAADKVLNLVDEARPLCEEVALQGKDLADTLERLADSEDLSLDRARVMMRLCARYASRASTFADGQISILSDIMMSQDFQDLSGQVIKRVIDIISRTETQLLDLLVDSAPEEIAKSVHASTELQGPQTPENALKQGEVDDLLSSLGF